MNPWRAAWQPLRGPPHHPIKWCVSSHNQDPWTPFVASLISSHHILPIRWANNIKLKSICLNAFRYGFIGNVSSFILKWCSRIALLLTTWCWGECKNGWPSVGGSLGLEAEDRCHFPLLWRPTTLQEKNLPLQQLHLLLLFLNVFVHNVVWKEGFR